MFQASLAAFVAIFEHACPLYQASTVRRFWRGMWLVNLQVTATLVQVTEQFAAGNRAVRRAMVRRRPGRRATRGHL